MPPAKKLNNFPDLLFFQSPSKFFPHFGTVLAKASRQKTLPI